MPNNRVWNKAQWDERNRNVVEKFRANGGKERLVLLTTIGAKSGQPRTTPLVYTRDGDRVIVIASKGGYPSHPDWFFNLVAQPEATIELESEQFRVRAVEALGEERQRLFDQMATQFPFFADYQKSVSRQIPVVILERAIPAP
jgi:deazaflavin-dependent oxidoreductase (nitroreductase family)